MNSIDTIWTDYMTAQTRQDVDRFLHHCGVQLVQMTNYTNQFDQIDQLNQIEQLDSPNIHNMLCTPQHIVVCALETHSSDLVDQFAELSTAEQALQLEALVYQLVKTSCYKMLVLYFPQLFEVYEPDSPDRYDHDHDDHDDQIINNIMQFDNQMLKALLRQALQTGFAAKSGRPRNLYHKLVCCANK
jgi:hypothetical protein